MYNDKANLYNLAFEKLNTGGKCQELIHVSGKGIKDSFKVSCENKGVKGMKSTDFMIYQNPGESLSLLSDKPSQLIVMKAGTCTLNTYKTVGRRTTSDSTPMSVADCEKAKKRITSGDMTIGSYSDNHARFLYGTIWRSFPTCFPFCISSAILDLLKTWPAWYDTVSTPNKGDPKKAEEEAARKKAKEDALKKAEEEARKKEEEEARKTEEEEAHKKSVSHEDAPDDWAF